MRLVPPFLLKSVTAFPLCVSSDNTLVKSITAFSVCVEGDNMLKKCTHRSQAGVKTAHIIVHVTVIVN